MNTEQVVVTKRESLLKHTHKSNPWVVDEFVKLFVLITIYDYL